MDLVIFSSRFRDVVVSTKPETYSSRVPNIRGGSITLYFARKSDEFAQMKQRCEVILESHLPCHAPLRKIRMASPIGSAISGPHLPSELRGIYAHRQEETNEEIKLDTSTHTYTHLLNSTIFLTAIGYPCFATTHGLTHRNARALPNSSACYSGGPIASEQV